VFVFLTATLVLPSHGDLDAQLLAQGWAVNFYLGVGKRPWATEPNKINSVVHILLNSNHFFAQTERTSYTVWVGKRGKVFPCACLCTTLRRRSGGVDE